MPYFKTCPTVDSCAQTRAVYSALLALGCTRALDKKTALDAANIQDGKAEKD